jgi:hypothetical protein
MPPKILPSLIINETDAAKCLRGEGSANLDTDETSLIDGETRQPYIRSRDFTSHMLCEIRAAGRQCNTNQEQTYRHERVHARSRAGRLHLLPSATRALPRSASRAPIATRARIHRSSARPGCRLRQRFTLDQPDAFALPPPHRNACFAIQPIHAFIRISQLLPA